MYKVYDKWPEIARESFKENYDEVNFRDIDHVVFAGMGGSGSLSDIFSSILSKTDIHVKVVKGHILPKTVDDRTLVITTSVSGNTIETLNILDAASKLRCNVIAFSSGGKIQHFCKKHKIEYRKIPIYHSPRASFTAYLYSMLKILKPIISIKNSDIKESLQNMEKIQKNISSLNLNEDNQSLKIAEWITGIPLIYYPFGLKATAIRFKNSLQENAKIHAISEDVVESCHNGIVAWERSSSVQPILIQGIDDFIKTKERWTVLKEYFKIKKIDYQEVYSLEGSILTKIINLIYVLDYASIYNAIISKIDPSPVYSIDFIKKRISE
jgi:glucose/mannose-6-phosphate isomerase